MSPNFDIVNSSGRASAENQMNDVGQRSWPIVIRGGNITIGCKSYTIAEWLNFSNKRISEMHPRALEWWMQVKDPLFKLLEALELYFPSKANEWEDDWL